VSGNVLLVGFAGNCTTDDRDEVASERAVSARIVPMVSRISACRLTTPMWIASPAVPNSAVTTGMPSCTVLLKVSVSPRMAGAAACPEECPEDDEERSARQAPVTAQPHEALPDDPPATDAIGRVLSPMRTRTWATGTSSASAAIWVRIVRAPVPRSVAAIDTS